MKTQDFPSVQNSWVDSQTLFLKLRAFIKLQVNKEFSYSFYTAKKMQIYGFLN